jgi:hypothetical protein
MIILGETLLIIIDLDSNLPTWTHSAESTDNFPFVTCRTLNSFCRIVTRPPNGDSHMKQAHYDYISDDCRTATDHDHDQQHVIPTTEG